MDLLAQLEAQLAQAISGLGLDRAPDPLIELTRDPERGEFTSNAALSAASANKVNPRELAARIAAALNAGGGPCASAEVAGPGFINMRLADSAYRELVAAIDPDYGRNDSSAGRRVNVEYISANPTGPLHVAHARGAVIGDCIASLLDACGAKVTREYYVNDAGGQISTLLASARHRGLMALGLTNTEPEEGFYPGEYLIPVGEQLAAQFGEKLATASDDEIRSPVLEAMLALIRADIASLGITFDRFSFESHYLELMRRTIAEWQSAGYVETSTLERPRSAADWQERDQLVFRATQFGDSQDRPLTRSDGSHTYFAVDIGYHRDKIERGHDRLINVLGADHAGYVVRLQAIVKALSGGRVSCDVVLCNLVKLIHDGAVVKMSKRAGTLTTVSDLTATIGADAVRFIMLTRDANTPFEFDLNLVSRTSRDNPVYTVQYAHARCSSALRTAHASETIEPDSSSIPFPPEARPLLRQIALWPRTVSRAASSLAPHLIVQYLRDLADELNAYWTLGNRNPELRFIRPDGPSAGNLRLARATRSTLSAGMRMLGITPLDRL